MRNDGGYRSARGAWGLSQGATYFEVELPKLFKGHVRVGFSTERGDAEAGVGYDEWQYGIRDLDGAIFFNSKGKSFGEPFVGGDRIGAYIYLPEQNSHLKMKSIMDAPEKSAPLAEIVRQNDEFWWVRILPETPYSLPSSAVIREVSQNSFVAFFKNGKCLGVAFRDLAVGTYYPSVSPYMCEISANFGPTFGPVDFPEEFEKRKFQFSYTNIGEFN